MAVSNITAVSENFERLLISWSPCDDSAVYTVMWNVEYVSFHYFF